MAEEKSQPTFRVRYFGGTGRAHPLRLALTLGGIAFVDEFVDFTEQKAAKESGKRRWSGLPELVVYAADGSEINTIGQSLAQLRFAGKLSGLYPSNIYEAALVDEILDATNDVGDTLKSNGAKDEALKALREAAIAKDGKLTYFLKKFELRLAENEKRGHKNGFFVGDSLSIADIKIFTDLTILTSGFYDYIPKDLFTKNHPELAKFLETVGKNETITAFTAKLMQRAADYKDDAKKKDAKVVTYAGKKIADITGCSGGNAGVQGVSKAVCILHPDGDSGVSGTVVFEDVGGKTKITAEVNGLSAGQHGFHIHQLGDLSGGCKTAKGHYNPFGKNHGGPADKERHVGDLGNIVANDKGQATCDIIDELVQLNGVNSVIGRSIVVHAGTDDLGKGGHDDSLTTGHAGSRVACGVIGLGN